MANIGTFKKSGDTNYTGEIVTMSLQKKNVTIVAEEAARSGAAFEAMVDARPLSQIVPMEELLAARLIKIDVEGAEWLVAQGMGDVLPRLRADVEILVEVKPDALAALGGSLDMFLALFERAGFMAYEIENSYQPADYMRPSQATPQRLRRRDFVMADLLFRRAPQPLLAPAIN